MEPPSAVYERLRVELCALVASLPAEDRARVVPATPAWTVHDALAHVVAISADLNAGYLGDGDAEAWTARQVLARRGRSVEALIEEWSGEAATFEGGLDLFGDEVGRHFVADLLQHLLDVRDAVGRPAPVDGDALQFGLDFYLDDLDRRLRGVGLGLAVDIGHGSKVVGALPTTASVRLSALDAFRALGGRLSDARLAELDWRGDADRIRLLLNAYGHPEAPPP